MLCVCVCARACKKESERQKTGRHRWLLWRLFRIVQLVREVQFAAFKAVYQESRYPFILQHLGNKAIFSSAAFAVEDEEEVLLEITLMDPCKHIGTWSVGGGKGGVFITGKGGRVATAPKVRAGSSMLKMMPMNSDAQDRTFKGHGRRHRTKEHNLDSYIILRAFSHC